MNLRFLITLVLSLYIGCQALQAKNSNTSQISGILLDEETQTAVDFVNVTLFKKGSAKPYKVKVSDTNGNFSFLDVVPGTYRLETNLLGYLTYKKEIAVTAGSEFNLGKITLKTDSKLLNTVEVTGIRSNMKLEIDKKTYSVDQSIAAAGASASDILKDIPSVEVDAEGSISLRNSASVTVWINGKPSGLTADNRGQVLEQMPAENIDRIEVVTNPSAKYSPEGSAGIINIILKKVRKSGYYGSVNAGVNHPWGKNFGANVNYSSSKLDAYANIGLRDDEHTGNGNTKRRTYDLEATPIDTTYLNSQTRMTHGGDGLFMRAGLDYHINDKHTLSLSGFAMDGGRSSSSRIYYDYLDHNQALTRQQLRNSTGESSQKNYNMSLDYVWEIGENHSLQANLSHGNRNNSDITIYDQEDKNSDFQIFNNSYQRQKGPSSSEDWEFKADYSKTFSENWKFEAGVQSEWENRLSDNDIYNGIASGNSWIIPSTPDIKNGFDYKEQQHAAYSTLTGKIGPKFGYQIGLRGEKTIISFISTDINGASAPINKNYLDLFPTLFFNYKIAEGSDVQLNYSKRINRPRGRSINPYVDISDSTSIRSGNPDLNPEYAHAFEMNYMKSWQDHTLSSSIYHRITNHVIQDVKYMDNKIMYQKPYNITNTTSSGLELVSKDKISKMLETTATINLYHSTLDGFKYKGYDYPGTKGFSWNARLNGTFIFPHSITAQLSGFYSAPRIVAQGESNALYSMDLGLRKSFQDNKFQVSFNARNILNSFKFENNTWGPAFYEETSNRFFGRDLRLNLTWNFGNLKPKPKHGKEKGSEESMDMDTGQ